MSTERFSEAELERLAVSFGEKYRVAVRYFSYNKNNNSLSFELQQEYNYLSFTFAMMKELAEMFKTEKLNTRNGYSSSGCETCDYGSSYTVEIELFELGSMP